MGRKRKGDGGSRPKQRRTGAEVVVVRKVNGRGGYPHPGRRHLLEAAAPDAVLLSGPWPAPLESRQEVQLGRR